VQGREPVGTARYRTTDVANAGLIIPWIAGTRNSASPIYASLRKWLESPYPSQGMQCQAYQRNLQAVTDAKGWNSPDILMETANVATDLLVEIKPPGVALPPTPRLAPWPPPGGERRG